MPNGDIRAFDPTTADKRGITEMMITDPKNESPTILTTQIPKIMEKKNEQQPQYRIRKLTPRECFRLMDVDDKYIDKMVGLISQSQCYKLAGNSIVVSCMFHIFKNLFGNEIPANQQLSLF